MNYLTPTKKPIGWTTDTAGRRKRIYDKPATPYQRLLAAEIVSPTQQAELTDHKASLKPAAIAAQIADIQTELTRLAGLKARRLDNQLTWTALRPSRPQNPSQLTPFPRKTM